jgi:gamma-glutamylaminecyclotransferase
MRALTIRQPWATLILLGRKTVETRTARTKRRGRVFLHAGASMGRAEREAAIREGLDPDSLPLGKIVGSIEITDSKRVEELQVSDAERARGDYRPGRWGWTLANVRALRLPVPAKGALSFWLVPDAVAQAAGAIERPDVERVFVYGSLKRGSGNHRILEGSLYYGHALILGTMYDYGAFPAVDLAGRSNVHGEVYEVSAATLDRLDSLEGHPHFYQRTRVRMSTGDEAWVYSMTTEKLTAKRVIASGNWVDQR